jgi:hypothetical protein
MKKLAEHKQRLELNSLAANEQIMIVDYKTEEKNYHGAVGIIVDMLDVPVATSSDAPLPPGGVHSVLTIRKYQVRFPQGDQIVVEGRQIGVLTDRWTLKTAQENPSPALMQQQVALNKLKEQASNAEKQVEVWAAQLKASEKQQAQDSVGPSTLAPPANRPKAIGVGSNVLIHSLKSPKALPYNGRKGVVVQVVSNGRIVSQFEGGCLAVRVSGCDLELKIPRDNLKLIDEVPAVPLSKTPVEQIDAAFRKYRQACINQAASGGALTKDQTDSIAKKAKSDFRSALRDPQSFPDVWQLSGWSPDGVARELLMKYGAEPQHQARSAQGTMPSAAQVAHFREYTAKRRQELTASGMSEQQARLQIEVEWQQLLSSQPRASVSDAGNGSTGKTLARSEALYPPGDSNPSGAAVPDSNFGLFSRWRQKQFRLGGTPISVAVHKSIEDEWHSMPPARRSVLMVELMKDPAELASSSAQLPQQVRVMRRARACP